MASVGVVLTSAATGTLRGRDWNRLPAGPRLKHCGAATGALRGRDCTSRVLQGRCCNLFCLRLHVLALSFVGHLWIISAIPFSDQKIWSVQKFCFSAAFAKICAYLHFEVQKLPFTFAYIVIHPLIGTAKNTNTRLKSNESKDSAAMRHMTFGFHDACEWISPAVVVCIRWLTW